MKRLLFSLALCAATTLPTWAQQSFHDQDTNADYSSQREEFLALVGDDAMKEGMTPELYTVYYGHFVGRFGEHCPRPYFEDSVAGQRELRVLKALKVANQNLIGKGDLGHLLGLAAIGLMAGSEGLTCEELNAEYREIFGVLGQ